MRQRKRDTPKNGTGFVLCLTEMIDEENGDNSNVRQLKRSLAVVTCATRWEEETKREKCTSSRLWALALSQLRLQFS